MRARQMSPLTLAFLGDAVFELHVREKLAEKGSAPVGNLHRRAVSVVCAKAQSLAADRIASLLTEEELAVYKRGRNTVSYTHLDVYKRQDGATVSATLLKNGKGKKITVFTYKPKKSSKRKMGHRQPYSQVRIDAINA